jgi:putative transposase
MRYGFIQRHAHDLPVRRMCVLLEVQPSGYYAWTHRSPCDREVRRLELLEQIRRVHERPQQGVYGSPRVHEALRKQGVTCSRKRVERLMREAQIRSSIQGRRFRVMTTDSEHGHPVAENLLDRNFQQARVDRAWAVDITYVATDEGWLYLASVMDLCSRKIVGWWTSDHLRAELPMQALRMAIAARRPQPGLLHHSDRGVQYACSDYQALLERHEMTCSMSRRGNCYDNAPMESFFKTFKCELVYQEHYATRAEAAAAIHPYIELFYNRQRLHSSLGYRSPAEYERQLG